MVALSQIPYAYAIKLDGEIPSFQFFLFKEDAEKILEKHLGNGYHATLIDIDELENG